MMGRGSFADDSPMHTGSGSIALVHLADFQIGTTRVSPATRTLSGPAAELSVEPRVMQVLVALGQPFGAVSSRDDLLERCWNGQVVGDDSVHRAIGELRRALEAAGARFAVETIPRIGYRLRLLDTPAPASAAGTPNWSRRAAVFAGAAAVAGVGVVGYRWLSGPRRDRRVAELIARGRLALRPEMLESTREAVKYLSQAVELAPDDSLAWGTLAMAWRHVVDLAPATGIASAVIACEDAIRHALALDPRQAEALAAEALLPPIFGDWQASERRLSDVLAVAPNQMDALDGLGMLLFSVGRIGDALEPSRQLVEIDPLSPIYQYRHAYRLWSVGDTRGADRVIDGALQLWPSHPAVWYARFLIFAASGRANAAERLLARYAGPSAEHVAPSLQGWPLTLATLLEDRPATREAAVYANLAAARTGYGGCTNALIALSQIGELDAAFDVAQAAFLDRGELAGKIEREPGMNAVNDQRWRKTMVFFTPATTSLRSDPRFGRLCEDIGLADYWRVTGARPDHLQRV